MAASSKCGLSFLTRTRSTRSSESRRCNLRRAVPKRASYSTPVTVELDVKEAETVRLETFEKVAVQLLEEPARERLDLGAI